MTTTTIQLRRDTAANWSNNNPILAQAEIGVELGTGKIKVGDGATTWNALDYFAGDVASVESADRLTTPRTISGVSFDGTTNIDIPFSGVTSKPTTLSGYGISDAAPSSHVGDTGSAHGLATAITNGFMSSEHFSKLNGIESGANNYTLPAATTTVLGGVKDGTGLTIAGDGTVSVDYGSTANTAVQGNDARVTADQSAAVASIRTLGTGAQQAAAGNHTHTGVYQPVDADLTAIAALVGTSGLLKKTATDTWTLDTTTYSTLELGTTAGAALAPTGAVGVAITAAKSDHVHPFPTAANVGAVVANTAITASTATKITYDAKGLVTAGSSLTATDIPSLDASKITTGVIDAARLPSYVDDVLEYANLAAFPVTGESSKIYVALDTNKIYRWSGSAYIEIAVTAGSADTATKLTTTRTIASTGDATWSVSFDGSANVAAAMTLANSGVTAGTYKSVTVDSKGRVTAGTNPTTLAGYGITDAAASSHTHGSITNAGAIGTTANLPIITGTSGVLNAGAWGTASAALGTSSAGTANTFARSDHVHPFPTAANVGAVAANTAITGGTATKITYDAKGLVTAGSSLTATDIPSLDASKITTGTLGVARGGTGVDTLTGMVKGNGVGAFTAAVAGTDYLAPSTLNWQVKTGNYTAVNRDKLYVNTSGGAVTVTLPASPAAGTYVEFSDGGGAFATNSLTVARNGQTIMGLAEDMIVNTNGISFGLVFNGSTWRVF